MQLGSGPLDQTHPHSSSGLRLALGVSLLLASGLTRTASAQTGLGGASGTTALAAGDLLIVVQSQPGVALPDFDLQRFFNVANCECNTAGLRLLHLQPERLREEGDAWAPGTIEFWVGLNCNRSSRSANCQKLGDTVDAGDVRQPQRRHRDHRPPRR